MDTLSEHWDVICVVGYALLWACFIAYGFKQEDEDNTPDNHL